jgi:hypothetical protein
MNGMLRSRVVPTSLRRHCIASVGQGGQRPLVRPNVTWGAPDTIYHSVTGRRNTGAMRPEVQTARAVHGSSDNISCTTGAGYVSQAGLALVSCRQLLALQHTSSLQR